MRCQDERKDFTETSTKFAATDAPREPFKSDSLFIVGQTAVEWVIEQKL